MKFFLLLAAAVPLLAQTCTYSPSPTSFATGADAVSGKIVVYTQQNCPWTAIPGVSWIHVTNAQIYIGSQTVTFTLDANTSTQIRTGSITVGDQVTQQTISFTQIAGNCNYQITPPLSASFPVGGGSGSFAVTAGCNWSASSNVSWIAISAPATVLGNGTVSYSAAANSCVASRSGTITVNTGGLTPPTFAINEDGSTANLTISPTSAAFGPAAATGRFNVTTGNSCPWSAFTDANWLQITGGSSSSSGSGAVTFSLTQNVGPPRTGHLTVGSQVFTVMQDTAGSPAPVLSAIVNSASGASGAVAPGEIVSLFGANMGPASGVPFSNTILTLLAGVKVMFGSSPAPLTYVSASQINAVVPYGVTGSASTQIQVQYQGQSSNTLSATVQTAAPAIFSADMSGHGPGAILNSDYKLNSSTYRAPIGSVVMIYGTGGGVTDPASADGSLAPSAEPFPRLTLPVVVTIDGVPAKVTYSGGSPGLVAGLTQFNVTVPSGVTLGPAVPVLVQVGGFQSQPGLTMAVQ
jgi:uncharacterized protein (TIGR03437 family)